MVHLSAISPFSKDNPFGAVAGTLTRSGIGGTDVAWNDADKERLLAGKNSLYQEEPWRKSGSKKRNAARRG